jgi:hypothetical protein
MWRLGIAPRAGLEASLIETVMRSRDLLKGPSAPQD